MKSLQNPVTKVSADGKKCTVEFDIIEKDFTQFLVQRVTVGHLSKENMRHPRQVQISEEAVFVKAFGNGMAFPIDDVIKIASVVEPKTSFAPVFKKTENPLTVQIASELNPDFQWEICGNVQAPNNVKINRPDEKWIKIDGATSASLDPSKVKSNQWVRCIASSEAGSMASNPTLIK